ncbi:MAG: Hpt domain-containing protein [Candidatus Kapaibacterium sp.]|nr:MAG: Hpt domain-containing protein [Candidatus Kapabacteria bacterium]
MNTSSPQYFAQVSRDLEPLLERYFSNRKKDIATIKELLESGKFEEIRNIGHTMKGTGASYGFQYITEIGKSFENAAKESDGISIEGQLYELEQYINTVKIEFIDE